MSGSDSGVIDLFAIHKQASVAPPAPSPLASAPPPAFTTDLLSAPKSGPDLGLDDDENPFGNQGKKKKPVYFALIGAGALLVIGVAIAAFSGGSEPPKAAAAQKPAVTAEPAPAPPPPPVQTAEPSAPTPAAPSTGAVASNTKAPPARGGGAARKAAAPKKASGPKLEKIQSGGVPGK